MAQERGRHYELVRLGRTGIRSQTPAVAGYSAKGRIAPFDLSPSTPLRACPELAEGTGLSKAQTAVVVDDSLVDVAFLYGVTFRRATPRWLISRLPRYRGR